MARGTSYFQNAARQPVSGMPLLRPPHRPFRRWSAADSLAADTPVTAAAPPPAPSLAPAPAPSPSITPARGAPGLPASPAEVRVAETQIRTPEFVSLFKAEAETRSTTVVQPRDTVHEMVMESKPPRPSALPAAQTAMTAAPERSVRGPAVTEAAPDAERPFVPEPPTASRETAQPRPAAGAVATEPHPLVTPATQPERLRGRPPAQPLEPAAASVSRPEPEPPQLRYRQPTIRPEPAREDTSIHIGSIEVQILPPPVPAVAPPAAAPMPSMRTAAARTSLSRGYGSRIGWNQS